MWNLLCHSPLLLRHSSLPLPGFKRFKLLQPSRSLAPPATTLTLLQLLHGFLAAAATKPFGRQPLLLQGCKPALCLHRQRSSIAACPLPAHSPLLLGHSSLPGFKRLKPLKPSTGGVEPALSQPSVIEAFKLAVTRLQTFQTLTTLQIPRATCHHPYNPPTAAWLPRGSCHQALWPSAFAAPGLQPALCLHIVCQALKILKARQTIPRGSFHQAPGRQRSSIAACPLPAHSPLLLGHSSLPFASLQTLKTPKTPQTPKTAKTPKTLHRRCGTCFVIALCYWGIPACRYQAWRVLGVLGVLSVWRLANGRLECPNKTGLCAGKGQAAMLECWRPGTWWKLPRGMVLGVLRV